MGFPPPEDQPPPAPEPPAPPEVPEPPFGLCLPTPALPQISLLLPGAFGFGISIKGFGLCGFKIPPDFEFNPSYTIPFPDLTFPPLFFFALCLKCDLSDPIDVEFGPGGGRVPGQIDPDADDEFVID